MSSSTVPDLHREAALSTYMYLRWLLVLLPALLLVVSVASAIEQQDLPSSISAYYGGPVRDVFVGVLIATAACLVAYQGSSLLEDYALNGAGFYAIFVALVPAGLSDALGALDELVLADVDGPSDTDFVWSLRFAITAVLGLCAFLALRELQNRRQLQRLWERGGSTRIFIGLTIVLLVFFLVLVVYQLWLPAADQVRLNGISLGFVDLTVHDLAAILLMAALAVVVASHAFPAKVTGAEGASVDRLTVVYRGILIAMTAGTALLAALSSWAWPDHIIILVEWWLIVFFCVFWVVETLRVRSVLRAAVGAPDLVG